MVLCKKGDGITPFDGTILAPTLRLPDLNPQYSLSGPRMLKITTCGNHWMVIESRQQF
jgi:hypothetical protein